MKPIAIGDYVLATKFTDSHCGDPWAVGYVSEIRTDNRPCGRPYIVANHDGTLIPGVGIYRFGKAKRIGRKTGDFLVRYGAALESLFPARSLYGIIRNPGLRAAVIAQSERGAP